MARVQREMGDAADRRAWFVAALCLAWPDGHTETFVGRVEGTAVWPPRGDKGFGYDPMFLPGGSGEDVRRIGPGRKARGQPPRARLRPTADRMLRGIEVEREILSAAVGSQPVSTSFAHHPISGDERR